MKHAIHHYYWKLYTQYRQEEGQDLIEYALLAGLLALAVIAGLMSAGSAIQDLFWRTAACIGSGGSKC
ncbi:MAG: Flp family type IVb pilin [Caldilinea sp.]